jgi:hypothetical protein
MFLVPNTFSTGKELQAAQRDPRASEIAAEIRNCELKSDSLKRQMEDDQALLDTLRKSSDQNNTVEILQQQYLKDRDLLLETFKEQSGMLLRFNLKPISEVPDDNGDDNGDLLCSFFDELKDKCQDKFDECHSTLRNAKDLLMQAQRVVSDKTVLLGSKQQAFVSMKRKLEALSAEGGCLSKVRRVVEELRRAETNPVVFTFDEWNPRKLLDFLEEKIEEFDASMPKAITQEAVFAVIKKLKKMVSIFLKLIYFLCRWYSVFVAAVFDVIE